LRHAFITAALDAGVLLRDVQEAASHADPRATMRYDRSRTAWTGTLPTSSPRSSPEQPGKPFILVPGSLAARRARLPITKDTTEAITSAAIDRDQELRIRAGL
jgi:hypothetical protein